MSDFSKSLSVTASGLRAQAARLTHVSENISNAEQLQAQGAPRELKLRVDSGDEIVEATLVNGLVME